MARIPAPRKLDERLGEFWSENPFRIQVEGHNLSGYERNRAFLNIDGTSFHDISVLTTADSTGDGRGVIAADLTGDGMQDLVVRQAGGGVLLLYENRFPKANWLSVRLRGTASNRWGIGARLVAEVGPAKLFRELFPRNGYSVQGPSHVHFGLAQATAVDRLTVYWPSGEVQQFTDVNANQKIVLTEGNADVHVRSPR